MVESRRRRDKYIYEYCFVGASESKTTIGRKDQFIRRILMGKENIQNKSLEQTEIELKEYDVVNRPAHYADSKIEVIDYIEDKKLGFCLGNAIKYISRAGKKKDSGRGAIEKEIEDLKKAIWYINRRIYELEKGR